MLPKTSSQTTGEPSWRYRRIMVFAIVAFCMLMLWLLIDRTDTGLNGTIAAGLLWLLGVIALLYTGFATVQDVIAIWRTRSGLPYAPHYPADIVPPERPEDRP
jgi:hypothetical protein